MSEYRKVKLDDWELFGEGGNGKTYISKDNDTLLLKVNKGILAEEKFVREEYDMTQNVSNLGISTPQSYEIVDVDGVLGTIFQRVKDKKSFSRIMADNPEKMDECARILAEEGKKLHSIPCNTTLFESRKSQALKGLDMLPLLGKKYKKVIREFVESMPDSTTCLHGDFQQGNLIASEGKTYWIDLGRFSYGDSMVDIAHLYMLNVEDAGIKMVQNITHMSKQQMNDFWKCFVKYYIGTEDATEIESFTLKTMKYLAVDKIARLYLQPDKILSAINSLIIIPKAVKAAFPDKF